MITLTYFAWSAHLLTDCFITKGFPDSSVGKESACNAGGTSLIPGLGRSAVKGIGYTLQYSGLENSMNCLVHGVAKSHTQLSDFNFHFITQHIKNIYIFTYLFIYDCAGSSSLCGLFSGSWRAGATSQLWRVQCPVSLWSTDSRVCKLQQLWQLCLQGFRAQPNSSGLLVQWHMGSSRIRQDSLLWQADSSPLRHQESPHTEHFYVIIACRVWDVMNCISIKCI